MTHSDYHASQQTLPQGVRVLTFFMYLNDVEEGGGTNFPLVTSSSSSSAAAEGLTVWPKKGRAVLWPSVLNDRPHERDPRADHQAQPVIQGMKYGANLWIHQRNFRLALERHCI